MTISLYYILKAKGFMSLQVYPEIWLHLLQHRNPSIYCTERKGSLVGRYFR